MFITAIVPDDADADALGAVFRAHGRVLYCFANASLAVQLAEGQSARHTTAGHCDCGTPLGAASHGPAGHAQGASDQASAARMRRMA